MIVKKLLAAVGLVSMMVDHGIAGSLNCRILAQPFLM
jgi:hypothetical protein